MKTCLVNLYDLDPPRNGGMSRVAYLVCRLLAEYAGLDYVTVFFAVGASFSGKFREWLGHSGGTLIPVLAEDGFPPFFRSFKPDLIISPLFGTLPVAYWDEYTDIPHIASMPDALALDLPDLFTEQVLHSRREIYDQLKHASLVVTLSEHARGRLIHHLALKEEQITVSYVAGDLSTIVANELLSPQNPIVPSAPYIFYPANGWPHKRHELLLRIMNHIWKNNPDQLLVLAGWHPNGYIQELVKQLGCPTEKIIDLGYIGDPGDMVSLYRSAQAMIFVSEYEGFCMPVLEAMQNDCPVICAPIASLPEVAGDAALYVNTDNPEDWAKAFLEILPSQRDNLIKRGGIQAAHFSWKQTRSDWVDNLSRFGLIPEIASPSSDHFVLGKEIDLALVLKTWVEYYAISQMRLEEKEKFIQETAKFQQSREIEFVSLKKDLIARESAIQSFRLSIFFWLINGPFGRFIPFRSFLIKLGIRDRFRPKLGVLIQYPPRPLKIPVRYRQEARLPEDELPVISMVTPSFNQAVFLDRTIQSILSQEYPRLEYVLQDGNSTDGSADILEKYRPQLTHVESVRDGGQAHAINLGFRHTTGQIMAYMNSDDMLLPGALHYVAKYFARHPQVDVVYGHRIIVDENDQEVGVWVLPPHDGKMLEWGDYVPQETMFWRREIWDKSGGKMDESFKFALDWDLLNRFQQAGARIVRLPRFLAVFRVHDAQKSTAQIHDIGLREMNQLRQQIHGRKVQPDEINSNLRPYLVRSVIYHKLYRLGILRY